MWTLHMRCFVRRELVLCLFFEWVYLFSGNCPDNCPHFIVCNLHLSGLCQACTKRLFTDHIVWIKQAFWKDVARWAPVWTHTLPLRAGHLSLLLFRAHCTHIHRFLRFTKTTLARITLMVLNREYICLIGQIKHLPFQKPYVYVCEKTCSHVVFKK